MTIYKDIIKQLNIVEPFDNDEYHIRMDIRKKGLETGETTVLAAIHKPYTSFEMAFYVEAFDPEEYTENDIIHIALEEMYEVFEQAVIDYELAISDITEVQPECGGNCAECCLND